MLPELSAVYLGISLTVAARTAGALRRLPIRRGEHRNRVERGFLWAVAILSSLLWIAFLPVFVRGWLRERLPEVAETVRAHAAARAAARARARAATLRPHLHSLPMDPSLALPSSAEVAPPQWLLSVSGGTRQPVAALLPAPVAAPPQLPAGPATPVAHVRSRRRRSNG